jgi:tetratricopeptide (TPR) repeat protein
MSRLWFWLVLLCLHASPVWAQSQEDIQKAATLFDQAETFYQIQDYQKALELYKEAFVLSKATELLFNIGQCYRFLGQPQEAKRAYNTFLRSLPAESSLRTDVERIIASLPKEKQTEGLPTTTMAPPALLLDRTRVFDLPGKELARTFVVSEVLLGSFIVLGASSLAFKRIVENTGDVPESRRNLGFALSLAADISWIGAGVSFAVAYKKKNNQLLKLYKEQSPALSVNP